ncbi:hypothetical protein TRSC58_07353 [Trypanosoma rangeli SC58]|uniref:Uncharacterized protein n=1 Tax=Trypanosoma rangeli SC58 TaxID=429131 RepID=A0A061ITF8_TRYRA|nr:hypothetical protein TRSC58_07353 [Trypanosoma rangeli SC58]
MKEKKTRAKKKNTHTRVLPQQVKKKQKLIADKGGSCQYPGDTCQIIRIHIEERMKEQEGQKRRIHTEIPLATPSLL